MVTDPTLTQREYTGGKASLSGYVGGLPLGSAANPLTPLAM